MRAQRAKSFQVTKKIIGLSALLASSTVFAAGFQIQEQNAAYLGTAYAGTAAWALDASSAFYNPAALTHIKDKQLVLSGTLIWGSFDFETTNSNVPFLPMTPVTGEQSPDPGGVSFVPALHYAARLTNDIVFGLSVAPGFGLENSYGEDEVMRYVATDSGLRTIDIIPSLAWRATHWLSMAIGPDFLFADAKLDAKTNFGNVPGTTVDGFQKNRARDWAFGWHAGLLFDIDEGTRVGLQYRSKFDVKAEGDSRNLLGSYPPGAFGVAPGIHSTRKLQAAVTLPETVVLSGYYEVVPCLALVADVAWTRWSRFKELVLKYSPAPINGLGAPLNIDTITPEEWKNVWRIALGGNYEYSDELQFRAGMAWDQSPVKEEYRTARIPDSDRIWLGIGVGWDVLKCLHIDASYAHLFFKDGRLSDTGPLSIATGTPALPLNIVEGEFSPSANIFGVQLRYDFV